MQADHIARVLFPAYGAWQCGENLMQLAQASVATPLYGTSQGGGTSATREEVRKEQLISKGTTTAAGFVLFLFLVVFAILVPAVQAFSCMGGTTLYLPGWAWGILILLFWPLGLVWLVFKGGCPEAPGAADVFSGYAPKADSLPMMPGLFGNKSALGATAVLLSPGDTLDGSSLFA